MGEGDDLGMFGENFENSSFTGDTSVEQISIILSSKKNQLYRNLFL
jgi:hypothetical protein